MPLARPVGRVGAGGGPEEWFYGLPPITRTMFVAILGTTCLCSFGMISPMSLTLDFGRLSSKFEVWRLATNFVFFGTFSFPFLIQMYIFVQYSQRYEVAPFNTGAGGTSADYAWMLCIGAALLTVMGFFASQPFLGQALSFMVLYVWSRKNPDAMTSIFGFQMQAFYLPWALIALNVLIGNPIFMSILGVVAGHIYYFLHYIAPESMGIDPIKTPLFLIEWFGGRPQPV
eukprot:CAMPEP_0119538048 /NCGR_PEP_ID=MMETSP1344-20130328/50575_1 /TAXON_ID=236787 /ORGANISM="Florenciella parvula, Strain CCMP2471" /LENGTH=228 /DNA_ID=CAMNT_0007580789 /DNA_START=18 /DNA_END=701 /DNA_ORIENTATION=+